VNNHQQLLQDEAPSAHLPSLLCERISDDEN
jgi:hypothetical protein